MERKDHHIGGGHEDEGAELMRCDLHVHSWYSGRAEIPVLEHVGRECYSPPLEVHDRARRRGMDLVTLTDHDTVEGALAIAHLPDTFVSEEVTVRLDGGRQLHVNVFGLDERQHQALQARRRDLEALIAFLAEERLPASVNHLFSALTGARDLADLRLPLGRLPLIEALSGAMPDGHNERARLVGRVAGMAPVGGSDAHSLAHVARAFTTVPGARTKEEFLGGLRKGLTVPSGRSGSYARLTSEVVRIFTAGYAQTARELLVGRASALQLAASLALAPLLSLIPLVTLAVYFHERRFGALHFRRFQEAYGWPALPWDRPAAIEAPSLGQAA
ncbi:MAG TPA: PHP-associated domain-containing protein [Vicinamibacteria bacterium]|nr:PHP-associated domain-containing protein [Vicinamibacteria bacterium]